MSEIKPPGDLVQRLCVYIVQNITMMWKYTMRMNRTSAIIALCLLLLLLTLPAAASGFTLGVFRNAKMVVAIESSTEMPDMLRKKAREEGFVEDRMYQQDMRGCLDPRITAGSMMGDMMRLCVLMHRITSGAREDEAIRSH